jgi:hypothetical protein
MATERSSTGYLFGGALFIGLALFSIASGEMPLKSGDAIRRAADPAAFWLFVGCFAAAGAGFVAWGLRVRKREEEE